MNLRQENAMRTALSTIDRRCRELEREWAESDDVKMLSEQIRALVAILDEVIVNTKWVK